MGSSWPLQSAQPFGAKLKDMILISERNGSDIGSRPFRCAQLGNVPQAPRATCEVLLPSSMNLLPPASVLLAWRYVELEPPVPSTVSWAPAGGPALSAR